MSKMNSRVAILVENNYQEMEVWYPIYRIIESGMRITVIGPEKGRYVSKLGYPVQAELAASDARAEDYDAIIVPGGFAPDLMRLCKPMLELVGACHRRGAVVAAICHGTWVLISAGLAEGRRLTGAPSIADDIRNAGGNYVDQEMVRDGSLITSRKPDDIPAFSAAVIDALAEKFGAAARP